MYYQDTAIVLARQNYREDDLLISVYTEKHGKVILQAKGAKKIKSKLAGHIEPMNLVELNWVAGKGRDKLIGASLVESFKKIKEDGRKVNYGFYFLEVMDKSIRPHHSDKRIFDFLKSVLDKLANGETPSFVHRTNFSIASQPRRDPFDKLRAGALGSSGADELKIIKLAFDYKILFLLGYHPAHRKELDARSGEMIKQIIDLPVDEIIKMAGQLSPDVYNKSKEFFEEVVEEEILSLKNLNPPFVS